MIGKKEKSIVVDEKKLYKSYKQFCYGKKCYSKWEEEVKKELKECLDTDLNNYKKQIEIKSILTTDVGGEINDLICLIVIPFFSSLIGLVQTLFSYFASLEQNIINLNKEKVDVKQLSNLALEMGSDLAQTELNFVCGIIILMIIYVCVCLTLKGIRNEYKKKKKSFYQSVISIIDRALE